MVGKNSITTLFLLFIVATGCCHAATVTPAAEEQQSQFAQHTQMLLRLADKGLPDSLLVRQLQHIFNASIGLEWQPTDIFQIDACHKALRENPITNLFFQRLIVQAARYSAHDTCSSKLRNTLAIYVTDHGKAAVDAFLPLKENEQNEVFKRLENEEFQEPEELTDALQKTFPESSKLINTIKELISWISITPHNASEIWPDSDQKTQQAINRLKMALMHQPYDDKKVAESFAQIDHDEKLRKENLDQLVQLFIHSPAPTHRLLIAGIASHALPSHNSELQAINKMQLSVAPGLPYQLRQEEAELLGEVALNAIIRNSNTRVPKRYTDEYPHTLSIARTLWKQRQERDIRDRSIYITRGLT